MVSSRGFALVLAVVLVFAVAVGSLLTRAGSVGEYVAGVDPLALAAFAGVVGLLVGAALANALAGPDGPQGPDGATAADRRRDANEWRDPPGVDADWDDDE